MMTLPYTLLESSKGKVSIVKEGYCCPLTDSDVNASFRADGSITLVQSTSGAHTVLVDTGGPWDKQHLTQALRDLGVPLGVVDHVVCTHGHSDHVGNLNLFPDATQIVGWDVCRGDVYTSHPFSSGESYSIAPDLVVMPTPGHTHHDVSLIVKWEKTVVISGDLFESERDLTEPSLWRACSEDPDTQARNRASMLQFADLIVPGHGPPFVVREAYRTLARTQEHERGASVGTHENGPLTTVGT